MMGKLFSGTGWQGGKTPLALAFALMLVLLLALTSAAPAKENHSSKSRHGTRTSEPSTPPHGKDLRERRGSQDGADARPPQNGSEIDNEPGGNLADKKREFGSGKKENDNTVADPINVTTGNAYTYEEDLLIPGRGVPVQFVRFYNSQETISGPLGYGWTHIYNTTLDKGTDGSVTEIDPEGAHTTFPDNPDGSFASPHAVDDTLTEASDGTFDLAKKNGIDWHFDANGRLQEISDPNGNALTFAYTGSNLTKITDALGRDTVLTYNASNRITKITDPAGREVNYAYSAAGDLASVTDQAGKVTSYEYDANHNMTKITTPLGGVTTFAYDANDRAISTQSNGGARKMTFDYRPEDMRTLVTDSKGNQSTFYFDVQRRVYAIQDPYGEWSQFGWDPKGNKTSVTDPLGNTTSYDYDAAGNVTAIYEPYPDSSTTTNPTTRMTYEPNFNRPTSITDPLGNKTTFAYDARGNLIRTTDPLGNRTTFAYDAAGQLTRSTDPKGKVTTFTYDASGNLIRITDPALKSTSFAYGASGSVSNVLQLPTSVTDALNRTTDFTYDVMGRTTRVTNPLTPPDTARTSVDMAYNAMGDLTSMTDERGKVWTTNYDALGQKASETDPLGQQTLYGYDTEGNLTSVTDPAGTVTTLAYDKVRRLVKTSTPNGASGAVSTYFGYDAAGRQTSMTDPKGQTTTYAYDGLGRLKSVADLGPNGTTVLQKATYDYDLLGRMKRATNPNGHASLYAYDVLGRLTRETDPLGNATSYAYDANGNTTSRTDANGKTTTYAYDALNRLITTSYPDATKIQRTYDAVGNLLSTADKTGTTTYAYDPRDRLIRETFPGSRTLLHAYDGAGNRTAMTFPDGKKTLYAYDAANRLTSVTDREGAATTYAYNALDLPTRISYPTGAGETYDYDPLGRMTKASATGKTSTGAATTLASLSYVYDKNSNPVSITDKAGKTSTFTYDPLDRLLKEEHPDQTLAYAYDPAGNRKTMSRTTPSNPTPVITSYAYDSAERMTKAGSTITYAYDKNGQMTGQTTGATTTSYAYDFEGQMVKAGSKSYVRDAFGRVASSTVGTTRTDYLFDGHEVVRENVGTATPIYYTRGLDSQLVSRRAGTTAPGYYHHDAIGSVMGFSSTAASLSDTYSYTAFGGVSRRTGTSLQPYQYVGNAYDSATKLYDFHARTYDQGTGRFTSKDPVAGITTLPQTLNPYPYGVNAPLAHPDPSGRQPQRLDPGNAGGNGSYMSGGSSPRSMNKSAFNRTTGKGDQLKEPHPLLPYIPVVAPVLDAARDCEAGRYGWCAVNTGMAAIDIASLGTTGLARNAAKAAVKEFAEEGLEAGLKKIAREAAEFCVTNSFDADTPVLMSDGTQKPISEVTVGEEVLATDPETGETTSRKVTDVIIGDGEKRLVDVTIDGTVVTATEEHPFFVSSDGEWVDAKDLKEGDRLLTPKGETAEVEAVRAYTEIERVYNLTVNKVHTFYVGAGGEYLLTHNCKQDKLLSKGEIKKLIESGVHPHDLKPNSKYDLYKTLDGDIVVKPKGGKGPGEPTGHSIDHL